MVQTIRNLHLDNVYYTQKLGQRQAFCATKYLLHGCQNDHGTSTAYAIELSRRSVVVLALDEYGHGGTTYSTNNDGSAITETVLIAGG